MPELPRARRVTPSPAVRSCGVVVSVALLMGAPSLARGPNVVVVAVSGLNDFVSPQGVYADVLPDPQIRERVAPNLTRLKDSGVSFGVAIIDGKGNRFNDYAAHLRVLGGYQAAVAQPDSEEVWSRDVGRAWSVGGVVQRKWLVRTPTTGRGRRAAEDLSVGAWERLVDAQEPCAIAASAAAEIRRTGGDSPRALLVQVDTGGATPVIPAVFLDRFPPDAIRLPPGGRALRSLAARLGFDGYPEELTEDRDGLIEATRAWLALASFLDYAIDPVIEAVAEVNGDAEPDNKWVLLLVAKPLAGADLTSECGSRAEFCLVGSATARAGTVVATPFALSGLGRTIVELAGLDPDVSNADLVRDGRVLSSGSGTALSDLPGQSALPLLDCERYAEVVVGRRGDTWSIRSSRFRLVHPSDAAQRLYDLQSDPAGVVDLLSPEESAAVALGEEQVEAVRAWLAGKLALRLRASEPGDDAVAAAIASLEATGAAAIDDDGSPLPGDFNRDGAVDAADKSLLRDARGEVVPVGSGADGNYDGVVDDADDQVWRANYGRRAS